MARLDQFESVFRAADKPVYAYKHVEIAKILVVTDLPGPEVAEFRSRLQSFLSVLSDDTGAGPHWVDLGVEAFRSIEELLELVESEGPDLVCTYRNLFTRAWARPHSLGDYVDVLTQIASCPILVAPHPKAGREFDHAMKNTDRVMAITDHLTGDDRLVNYAVRFTLPGGTLFLSHVEDEAQFERYIATISKIPSIDTDDAKGVILEQLLKEPRDYVGSCRDILAAQEISIDTRGIVMLGHHLREYKRLIVEHEVDLLVLNTKDEDQLAMHGLAYPLAVELREIPLLML
ncbi:MAG: hypothetical protein IH849_06725 [Acidobacteria bacterium]|nr:hypothetical protein [Acidobacteriota bacterium]